MGFAPTWLRQVRPPLHMTTLTTGSQISTKTARALNNVHTFQTLTGSSVADRLTALPKLAGFKGPYF